VCADCLLGSESDHCGLNYKTFYGFNYQKVLQASVLVPAIQ
jgi:hypothetical protein